MSKKQLKNINWYIDEKAKQNEEPGIYHSYMACLATALNYINDYYDPAWLMGSSAFAFRIFVNEILCPSAMSMFSFNEILPEAIEQSGYHCNYISRMWNESDKEEEKRTEAHHAIFKGIESGVPSIVWDIENVEWGLITGYNSDDNFYYTLTNQGKSSLLPYHRLGKNGIDILSVAIPGEKNSRTSKEIILNSLKAAVSHAEGKEWIDDRPTYQNGIAAYDLLALILERWTLLINAGKSDRINVDIFSSALYNAGHIYSARYYARDYLDIIAKDDELLQNAHFSYKKVAGLLKPIWEYFSNESKADSKNLMFLAQNIKEAKIAEQKGIENIKKYLS